MNYVTIKKFSELSGYSEAAIRSKITHKIFPEDKVWLKAKDNRILISISGYEEWVEMGLASKKRARKASRLISGTEAYVAVNESNLSPLPLT